MRQKGFWIVALTLVLALVLAGVVPRLSYADTITVDTTNDVLDAAGSCDAATIDSLPGTDGLTSLREAICAADNNTGSDTINFDIPGCGGVCTIQPTIALPALDHDDGGGTTINGYSQPGAAQATEGTPATLLIEIDGTNVANQNGLNVASANNMIQGLVINRFGWNGVAIGGSAATDNIVSGNHIGTDANGTTDQGNGYDGVWVCLGAQNNTVGGNTSAARNVISGNDWEGVAIHGNYIGTNVSGTAVLSNTLDGVRIYGEANNNAVGGDAQSGERNVISGNGQYGIRIAGSETMTNTISGNYIGLAVNGTDELGNSDNGIYIGAGAQNNTIGPDNVISGNGEGGVLIEDDGTTGNTVSGNYVGTDESGTLDLGNTVSGVIIRDGAQNNTIGGDTAGERNVISGNDSAGVIIYRSDTTDNTILGNYIGLAANGTDNRGNTYFGVHIWDAQNNTVGPDNVISGNGSDGVRIYGSDAISNTVSGNYIGLAANGTDDRGNDGNGVEIVSGAQNSFIGGNAAGERNVISGNDMNGVYIGGSGTKGNTVSGNYIGTDENGSLDRGNTSDGVYITNGAQNSVIGGNAAGERNVISGNDMNGVRISGSSTMSNTVSSNYVGVAADGTAALGNANRGIYIGSDAQNNTVGPGNVIAHNSYEGVEVNGGSTAGNTITQNVTVSNLVTSSD